MKISPELLTLIIKDRVKNIYKIGSNPNLSDNELPYQIKRCGDLQVINLDTLGRYMEEWCLNNDYVLHPFTNHCGNSFCKISSGVFGMKRKGESGCTKLGAITKATLWVAKESKLIKGTK